MAGQIWIPAVTVFIGAFTIAAVGIFQNSIALGFSYGVCVSTLVSQACHAAGPDVDVCARVCVCVCVCVHACWLQSR